MIEADVTIESGFIVLIVDVMNSRGHLKSLVTGSYITDLEYFNFSDKAVGVV